MSLIDVNEIVLVEGTVIRNIINYIEILLIVWDNMLGKS